MNFLCLGSLFLLFQLNFDWTTNYIIKLIGFLIFAGGIAELCEVCRMARTVKTDNEKTDKFFASRESFLLDMKKKTFTMAGMCALAALCEWALKYILKPADFAVNVISLILGAAVAYISLNLFRMTFDFIAENERLSRGNSNGFVNDETNITRLGSAFMRVALCTAVNVVFDVLNRLVPIELISSMAGFVVAASKILLYIFLLMLVFSFNKIRVDYNKKHDMQSE